MATLGDLSVGDKIQIKENGVKQNYIVVHKSKPSELYDDSCDGVWLLREYVIRNNLQSWHGTDLKNACNDYENSDINTYLNNTFFNTIDEEQRNIIPTVKIPFKKGTGDSSDEIYSGINGLSCKTFLLSAYETGLTQTDNQYLPIDGAKLDYFSDNSSRIGYYWHSFQNKVIVCNWWTRSPYISDSVSVASIEDDGLAYDTYTYGTRYVRPAIILPKDTLLDMFMAIPTIVSDKSGDIGTLNNGFSCTYSVDDQDADEEVTVTLKFDGKEINSFTAVKQQNYTFSIEDLEWRKILNGNHTFTIDARNSVNNTTHEIVFTKSCDRVAFSLETPLPADDVISVCSLKIKGLIATDTILMCEVTNNANDTTPVWEDCTAKVKTEMVYAFKNKSAENGFAFNFRISAQRGASGAGGYITSIEGGFG